MKSLQLLWQATLKNLGVMCDICTTFDGKTVERRFEDEGVSFLTITLPGFCEDFQKSLDRGWVDHDLFTGFRFAGGLPVFLGGFLDLVFDRRSGKLLDDPSIDAIFAIRQLTLMFSKINLRCTERRNRKAIDGYLECEKEVRKSDRSWTEADRLQFSRLSLLAFAPLFSRVERRINQGELRGRHGPGATADRLRGNAKYSDLHWTWRLEREFSSVDHLIPNARYHDRLEGVDFLEPGQEKPVKVTLVPKTLKRPRIIAMEPTSMQFMQQAILEVMMEEFERDDILSALVGFNDQQPNQLMADVGSFTGGLATLDLSEASDRVSNQHVLLLLSRFPDLSRAVQACRSTKAEVPGKGVIRLAKFASMGSALCFPMEAFVFLTLVLMGIEKQLSRPLTRSDLSSLRNLVRVYGDDIIVPVEFVTSVISTLEASGHQVNAGKSFWTGKFRESCGRDYYDGHDVTVVKVRQVVPTSRQNAQEILSFVSTRNQFYKAGLWGVSQWMDLHIEKVLRYFPIVESTSSVIGRSSFYRPSGLVGWDSDLHRLLVKGYRVRTVIPVSKLDDVFALQKFFLKRGVDPSVDEDHLDRSGRSQAVNIKLGWGPAY